MTVRHSDRQLLTGPWSDRPHARKLEAPDEQATYWTDAAEAVELGKLHGRQVYRFKVHREDWNNEVPTRTVNVTAYTADEAVMSAAGWLVPREEQVHAK